VKKWMIVAVVALLATLALAPTASAAETLEEPRLGLLGRGVLWAGGTGHVELAGAGVVRLAVNGDVSIVDEAGDARIWVRGIPLADDSSLTLEDFRGQVRVTGSDFTVTVDGRVLLRAAGAGSALLEGTGRYRIRHDGWGRWSVEGVEIAYSAA